MAKGVKYKKMDKSYFESRALKRHAGVWSLWALGVGAVISGHFSGWNLGLASGGWGGMFIATIIVAIMYIGLTQCVAEMSPALPHTGGAYSFARSAMGPWGGFFTGLVENLEFILTPAVIVFFLSHYMAGIFETSPEMLPFWWFGFYSVFTILNIVGVALSFRFTIALTFLALGCLVIFWISSIGNIDFTTFALDIKAGTDGKAEHVSGGGGPFLPMGLIGALKAMPFAVWLFLAIEQLPLAAEESVDPKKDMPKGLTYGIITLIISAFLILWLNASIPLGSYALSQSGEPLLDGFEVLFGNNIAKLLALVASIGLLASFHTIIFAFGRQIYSLSRAGYFPVILSVTHSKRKTPYTALILGSAIGFGVLMITDFLAGDESGVFIGGALLNIAVFSAMLSYILQCGSFILLRKRKPNLERPYRSPFGNFGGWMTIFLAFLIICFQLQDQSYRTAVFIAIGYLVIGLIYFGLKGRHRLILSPEEEFALEHEIREKE
ncbi:amino acid permease [Ulvibacterium marinum]|uniref:Amino acid permease n=1 Tax=Ulvibacterium marinum TaxID=2419782 RepID=A0A3B0BWU6_9FLAO|nr:amino acid permease [Ulvibacterium marinum]RKN77905.1 amino acid permease [Ulvibacterium marinum]